MIRNIIFDMGGVLVGYRPELSTAAFVGEERDALLVRHELFETEEWRLLDAGEIDEDEALARVQARLPKRLRAQCADVFAHWHEYLPPNEDIPPLIRELKARGLRVYLCSNAALRFYAYRDTIAAMALMDGILISAEERCLKPHRAIYERLFARFGLAPEECFFIDDLEANIAGGRACGMDGFVFTGDTAALRAALAKRGVL